MTTILTQVNTTLSSNSSFLCQSNLYISSSINTLYINKYTISRFIYLLYLFKDITWETCRKLKELQRNILFQHVCVCVYLKTVSTVCVCSVCPQLWLLPKQNNDEIRVTGNCQTYNTHNFSSITGREMIFSVFRLMKKLILSFIVLSKYCFPKYKQTIAQLINFIDSISKIFVWLQHIIDIWFQFILFNLYCVDISLIV